MTIYKIHLHDVVVGNDFLNEFLKMLRFESWLSNFLAGDLGKSPDHLSPSFLAYKMGIIVVFTSNIVMRIK